jgi:uncharacterized protein (TIGR02147 family)
MKTVSVFDFMDYKAYIQAWIATRPSRGRGEKGRIADAISCHSTYISQVLQGSAHLSLEQASSLNDYIGHNLQESRFFLLLLNRERAGNRSLKRHFELQIQEILEARTALRNRVEVKRTLDEKDQTTYYSSWIYAAVHMLVSMPDFQSKEALANQLQVPPQKISEVLSFLISAGLVQESGGRMRAGNATIHLGDNSPLISKHHTNWRLKAIQSMDIPHLHDLHYSSVGTINEKDLPKIRSILVKAIEEIRSVVKASAPEDTLFCYDLDLFKVNSSGR